MLRKQIAATLDHSSLCEVFLDLGSMPPATQRRYVRVVSVSTAACHYLPALVILAGVKYKEEAEK